MHLQPDVKRELRHIGIGCAVGAVVLSAGWGLLAAAGTGLSFGPAVPVSAAVPCIWNIAETTPMRSSSKSGISLHRRLW